MNINSILTILLIILSSYSLFLIWRRMSHALQMLQQCYYMNERYTTWLQNNKLVSSPAPLYFLAVFYWGAFTTSSFLTKNDTVLLLLSVFMVSISVIFLNVVSNFSKEVKKPLKITARVWRLILTILFVFLILPVGITALLSPNAINRVTQAAGLILTFHTILYYVVLAANFLLQPIEKHIRLGFIKKAQDIVSSAQNLDVIGITGSYGKTSTKHAVNSVLSEAFNTLMTPESYNTPMGVTITIRNYLKPIHSKFIAEMGAYKNGEIQEICDIVSPKYGILTSVGPQHLETFKTIENIKETKFELIEDLPANGIGFINIDDENIRDYFENKFSGKCRVLTYGINKKADYQGSDITVSEKGTTFNVTFPDGSIHQFQTKLLGTHNIYNIIASIGLGNELNIPVEKMKVAIHKMKPVTHRLELRRNGNFTIIDDAFNSNPVGSKMALEVLGQMSGKRIVLTPGMVDLGSEQYNLNKAFGTYMKGNCDEVILIGEKQTKPIVDGLEEVNFPKESIHVVQNLSEGFECMNRLVEAGAFVLIENDLPDLLTE